MNAGRRDLFEADATNGVDERVIARGWTTKVSALLLGSRSFLNQYARAPFPSLSDIGAGAGPLAVYSVRQKFIEFC